MTTLGLVLVPSHAKPSHPHHCWEATLHQEPLPHNRISNVFFMPKMLPDHL